MTVPPPLGRALGGHEKRRNMDIHVKKKKKNETRKSLEKVKKFLYIPREQGTGNTSKNSSYPPHNHDSPSPSPNTTKTLSQPTPEGACQPWDLQQVMISYHRTGRYFQHVPEPPCGLNMDKNNTGQWCS